MEMSNKELIEKFNKQFNSYKKVSDFCNKYNNDPERIVVEINNLIKYMFINKKKLSPIFLANFHYCDKDTLNEEYLNYLETNNKKKIFKIKHRKKRKINEELLEILDPSIKIEDVEGIDIPSKKRIREICIDNEKINKEKREFQKKRNDFYNKKQKFPESVLFYSIPELITLDKSFIYYHESLTGNINKDYEFLVNDERYKNEKFNNPFNNNFYNNLQSIRKHNDIVLKKYGDVYHIENGRHRLLYLIINSSSITIPVSNVRKRIEDREFNIILKELIEHYNIYVYKNNILNDDADILIGYQNKLYNLKNKDELKDFHNRLINNKDIDMYFICDSKIDSVCRRVDLIDRFNAILYEKYKKFGNDFITSNFTDIVKHFNLENNYYLRESFENMQFNYRRAKIFKYDFDKYYEILLKPEKFTSNTEKLYSDSSKRR